VPIVETQVKVRRPASSLASTLAESPERRWRPLTAIVDPNGWRMTMRLKAVPTCPTVPIIAWPIDF